MGSNKSKNTTPSNPNQIQQNPNPYQTPPNQYPPPSQPNQYPQPGQYPPPQNPNQYPPAQNQYPPPQNQQPPYNNSYRPPPQTQSVPTNPYNAQYPNPNTNQTPPYQPLIDPNANPAMPRSPASQQKPYLYNDPKESYPMTRMPGQPGNKAYQPITPYNQLSYSQTVYDDPRAYRNKYQANRGQPQQEILYDQQGSPRLVANPYPFNANGAPVTPNNPTYFTNDNTVRQFNKNNNPKYQLSYFDFDGRAEITRLIFTAAGLPFSDFRILPEDWPKIKPTMPLGNVPILEVNETTIPLVQSLAIARYAAKEADLAGRTSLEMAMADAVVDTALELFIAFTEKIYPLYKFPVATDRDRNSAIQDFMNKDVARTFNNLEKLMGLYGLNGYFVGDQMTWADLYVYQVITNLLSVNSNALQYHPRLMANRYNIEEDQRVARYLKTRPSYPPVLN